MSAGDDKSDQGSAADADPPKRKGKKLILIAGGVVALLLVVGGLGAAGLLPFLHHAPPAKKPTQTAAVQQPVFIDMPEMVVNLDAGPRHEVFAKVQCRVEAASAVDGAQVTAALPRIVDMLQTYLRAMRPDELRSGAGLYRLKEAFLARATIVVPTARLEDILFQELIIQ